MEGFAGPADEAAAGLTAGVASCLARYCASFGIAREPSGWNHTRSRAAMRVWRKLPEECPRDRLQREFQSRRVIRRAASVPGRARRSRFRAPAILHSAAIPRLD